MARLVYLVRFIQSLEHRDLTRPVSLNEGIPNSGYLLNNLLVAIEYSVGKTVLSEPLPNLLHWIQLWRMGGYNQSEILERYCRIHSMPACAINDDHCMPVALGCQRYQFKVKHHGIFVDQGRNQCFRFTATWAHCPKQIPIIKLLLFDDTETATPFCPKSCRLVLLTKSGFVLEPHIHTLSGR